MKRNSLPDWLETLLPRLQVSRPLRLSEGDVVIHAPGFEHRTMEVANAIIASGGACGILLDYRPSNPKNRLLDVREALSIHNVRIADDDILEYDRFDPADFEENLRQRLLANGARRAIVDISTMSKLAIILVLSVCLRLDLSVCILYCEAQQYGPTERAFERAKRRNEIHRPTLQVFTGVHGVVRVNSLASVAMQGQSTAALVFMSFNNALTQVLLNTVYPGRLFLINGRPPHHRWREAAMAWIHEQVRREWEDDNPLGPAINGGEPLPDRSVSTRDYRETVWLLLRLYWQLSANHRVLLAPVGSKLQTVGSYLVKALHPDIHIEYPTPEGFSRYLSFGVAARWLLDLGRVSERLMAISEAERHEYLEILT